MLAGEWWALARPVTAAAPPDPEALPSFPGPEWVVVDAAVGDVTGDGRPEVVVSFRRPFHDTPQKRAYPDWPWMDALGRSAHLGLWDEADLHPVYVAATVVRPIAAVAPCHGALAVAYSTLDDPAAVAAGAWLWRGFGFSAAPDLPGPGTPACADVDRDGSLDPVVLERSEP